MVDKRWEIEDILPKDLENICISYLTEEEQIYVTKKWVEFNKFKVCDIAAKYGWKDLLIWIIDPQRDYICNDFLYNVAAENGQFEFIKWLYDLNFKCFKLNEWFCSSAVKGGNLDILKWGIEKIGLNNFKYKYIIVRDAAMYNQLNILKYILELQMNNTNEKVFELKWDTCYYAFYKKNYEILNWIKDNGCKCGNEHFHKLI